jgi:hypothetical protein
MVHRRAFAVPERAATTVIWQEAVTSQSFTFIDAGGNHAQYTVFEVDHRNEYHWSTDHGDRGFDRSYTQAQSQARMALKVSMATRRRVDEKSR